MTPEPEPADWAARLAVWMLVCAHGARDVDEEGQRPLPRRR